MIYIPGKIPIVIHPFFWILASLIGVIYGGFSFLAILWIIVVFISVLFHEMGHAITAKLFGQHPQIALVALGGLTSYEGKGLSFFKQFLIILNGPVFGLLLALCSYAIFATNFFQNTYIVYFFDVTWKINVFWSAINLIPVIPLDGGQLLRVVFEAIFGEKGFRAAVFLSMVFAIVIALTSLVFYTELIIVAIVFFLFAFQNFELFRKSRFITSSDRDDEVREEIVLAEKALQEGNKEEAKKHFIKVREKGPKGLLFAAATQYLALLSFGEGDKKQAYDLLLSIKDQLTSDANLVLHELSFEFENYQLVAELSQRSYQVSPTDNVALINAKAFAHLSQPKAAGGWLQTALDFGNLELEKIIQDSVFKDIQNDPLFRDFLPKDRNDK